MRSVSEIRYILVVIPGKLARPGIQEIKLDCRFRGNDEVGYRYYLRL